MGLADGFEQALLTATSRKACLGFDAFVDHIARYQGSMAALGTRLLARDGLSFTVDLGGIRRRLGGNMPNTANALARLGVDLTCFGAFDGGQGVNPAFEDLAKTATLHSFGPPGVCFALEMDQGKVFFADAGAYRNLDWQRVKEAIPLETLMEAFRAADLVGLFNWGEIPAMQKVLTGLTEEVLSQLESRPIILVDPSDMGERRDIPDLLDLLRKLRSFGEVALSMNEGEAATIGQALGLGPAPLDRAIRDLFGSGFCDLAVIHTPDAAYGCEASGCVRVPTRKVLSPVMQTGGGDTFNAGLAFGLLCGLDTGQCLTVGNAASSYYVRQGEAPNRQQLVNEIQAICAGAQERMR